MKRKRPYVMTTRSAKAAATRQRICESVVELCRDRSMGDFTLDEVAERAGTTVQTVLRAFKSKDNLVIEALDRLTKEGSALLEGRPGGYPASTPGDVRAAIAAIVSVYETIGDLAIRHLGNEQRQPALKTLLDHGRQNHRLWVRSVFAPQLKQRSGSARSQLFNCLMVATDVYTWKILRRDLGLSRQSTEAGIEQLIAGVTTRESEDAEISVAELVGRRQPAA